MRNMSSGFQTRSDTNQAVQPQKRLRKKVCIVFVEKTKVLICTFVFADAKSRFSHDTAQLVSKELDQSIGSFRAICYSTAKEP